MQISYQTLGRLLTCQTTDELSRMVDILLGEFSASHWIYAFELDDGTRRFLGDYPADWLAHYQEQGYPDVDPTVLHVLQHGTPFVWPDFRRLPHDKESLLLPANRIFIEAHDHRLNGGITIPLHRGVKWGLLSLAFQRHRDSVDAEKRMVDLFFVAHHVHEVALLLMVGEGSFSPELTKRELDCLQLAASGHTTEQIALRLGFKPRLVTDIFVAIKRKLGTHNRQESVAAAITRKLVSL